MNLVPLPPDRFHVIVVGYAEPVGPFHAWQSSRRAAKQRNGAPSNGDVDRFRKGDRFNAGRRCEMEKTPTLSKKRSSSFFCPDERAQPRLQARGVEEHIDDREALPGKDAREADHRCRVGRFGDNHALLSRRSRDDRQDLPLSQARRVEEPQHPVAPAEIILEKADCRRDLDNPVAARRPRAPFSAYPRFFEGNPGEIGTSKNRPNLCMASATCRPGGRALKGSSRRFRLGPSAGPEGPRGKTETLGDSIMEDSRLLFPEGPEEGCRASCFSAHPFFEGGVFQGWR